MRKDKYRNFSELSENEVCGTDYRINICDRSNSKVIIVAPHGGGIEPHTSKIALLIASGEFSYYSFEGLKFDRNIDLHITSHNFDEPLCVSLVEMHDFVVSIHGYKGEGEKILIGGLDKDLICKFESALKERGMIPVIEGHDFLARNKKNICNRGKRNMGVQFELTKEFRNNTEKITGFVDTIRKVLSKRAS